MKIFLLILILLNFFAATGISQSFTIDELISLAYLPPKNIDGYMKKKGFILSGSIADSGTLKASFIEKSKSKKIDTSPKRSIDICINPGCKNYTLHLLTSNEYLQAQQRLIKSGYFYDAQKDITKEPGMLY